MKRATPLLLAAAAGAVLLWRRARRPASGEPAVLGPEAVRRLYDRLAPVYDQAATAYGLVGGARYRRRAVESLQLSPGDTAVDLCCGTGANLPFLVEAVGPTGRVVGVDLSPGMLAQARQRVEAAGWENVELVEADVRAFAFPEPVHGVLSTFGIERVPEHADVTARAVDARTPGGRIAVGGLRRPDGWPEWLRGVPPRGGLPRHRAGSRPLVTTPLPSAEPIHRTFASWFKRSISLSDCSNVSSAAPPRTLVDRT